jgi:hypothetical protein
MCSHPRARHTREGTAHVLARTRAQARPPSPAIRSAGAGPQNDPPCVCLVLVF